MEFNNSHKNSGKQSSEFNDALLEVEAKSF